MSERNSNSINYRFVREVRGHNNFAKRIPGVENETKHIEEEIKSYHDK